MEGGPPHVQTGFLVSRPTRGLEKVLYPYGAVTHFGRSFQNRSGFTSQATGLVRVRSPLLTESRLMSFPPVTEMVQFTGFASPTYVFSRRYRRNGGFPHSEISGSKCARHSPELIATCYVLHRLSTPRHPPDALLHLNVKLSRTDPRPRPPTIPPLPCERRKPAYLREPCDAPAKPRPTRHAFKIQDLFTMSKQPPRGNRGPLGNVVLNPSARLASPG